MKINITVDVEWIEEDGSIDEEVKHQIIQGVKNSISKTCLAKVEKQASTAIDKAINESIGKAQKLIESKAMELADNWLSNEVSVTDKWGDVVETVDIMTLIKNTYDRTLEKRVDRDGRFCKNSYGNNTRLIDWLTTSKVESVVQDKLKGLNIDIDTQITKAINAGIKENVSNKFAEMVIQTARANNLLTIE